MPKRIARHVPLRTCVACGKKTAKGNLIRIVAPPSGGVAMDPSGKSSGRGAYLCLSGDCAQEPLRRRRLDFAMRRKMNDDEWSRVIASVEALAPAER